MNIFKTTYKSCILLLSVLGAGLSACTDEKFDAPQSGWMDVDIENSVAIPLNIKVGVDGTRADEVNNGDQYEYSKEDHRIDLTTVGESFAILFNKDDEFLYLKPFFTNSQLGNGSYNSAGISEFTLPVMVYIPNEDVNDEKTKPAKILVVLNGGRIYQQILENFEIDSKTGALLDDDNMPKVEDFLNFEWKSTSNNDVIGVNDKGYFTMTNSTYFDEKQELQNVVSLDPNGFYVPKVDNMNLTRAAATIYVERMQAKFEAPDFGTQVIGSDRVFRPSQNAISMFIYDWDEKNQMISEPKNWRVHLLGWTINGRETSSYLFKHITDKNGNKLNFSDFTNWNDPGMKRSNWSVDPHYFTDDKNNDGSDLFYPWQYRIAVDDDQISLVRSIDGDQIVKNNTTLRYFNFNEVMEGDWGDALTISENTYDAESVSYKANDNNCYDGRAQLLCGPHLLVAAELFIESSDALDSDYLGQFKTVEDLYSDRYMKFYLSEKAWFKMFIRNFREELKSQGYMTFKFYNWDKTGDELQEGTTYTVITEGGCKLWYEPAGQEGKGEELTMVLLDELCEKGIPISQPAILKNGDGRVIPWIEGLKVRDAAGKVLKVYNDKYDPNHERSLEWTDDMRKSLFYEWFGPIDHYKNGYMYYAGAITHHKESADALPYFGSVRNHLYKFTVNSINALGTPVDDPTQPIIPVHYNYRDQLSVDLHSMEWHIIPTVDVAFSD